MALSRPPQAGAGAIGEDFPIVCEPCLGGNPYVRMLKGTMGKECRISGRPFNSFRWQGAHNKWKETVIAPEVAREKNCCMSCLNDLEYGVPFHVRDGLLEALGTDMAPESAVNKEFWWANKRQKQEDEGAASGLDTYATLRDNVDKLRAFAALEPGPIVRPRRETPLTPEEQERLRQRRLMEQKPPEDKSITSLYVGSVPPSVTKRDLMPYMMAYGAALPPPLPLTLTPTPTLTLTLTFSAATRRAARSGGGPEQPGMLKSALPPTPTPTLTLTLTLASGAQVEPAEGTSLASRSGRRRKVTLSRVRGRAGRCRGPFIWAVQQPGKPNPKPDSNPNLDPQVSSVRT